MTPANSAMATRLPFLLPRIRFFRNIPVLRRLYWSLVDRWEAKGPPVMVDLHGFPVLINRGNSYPSLLHEFPDFNAPLIQLVLDVARERQRPLTMVDVGAAIGDTVLLIKQRAPKSIGRFICVEGDDEFFALLTANCRQFNDVIPVNTLLARERKQIRSLTKHHLGTASAVGDEMREALPLDSIKEVASAAVDLLKVDVDGFDGDVLAGATQTLRRCRPYVIFEWHPRLITEVGNHVHLAFETLAGCNYSPLLWFTNTGQFSHFTEIPTSGSLRLLHEYLVKVNPNADSHFDVIALPAETKLDPVSLASLSDARSRG
jgi:FkbM family methyltransferase